MKIKKVIFIVIITILCTSIFLLWKGRNNSPYIEMKYPVDTLSFKRSNIGNIEFYVKLDTIDIAVVFDTGTTYSLFSDSRLQGGKDAKLAKNIWGNSIFVYPLYLDTIIIGNTKYYQKQSFNKRNSGKINLLGDDILQNFAWKIDFIRQKIYFSKSIIPFNTKNEMRMPFRRNKYGNCFINCTIDDEPIELLLDTGNPIFANINGKSGNKKDSISWIKHTYRSDETFGDKREEDEYIKTYTVNTIEVDSCHLANEIVIRNVYKLSSLGLDFFERYEYVIFDYPNETIYFGPYRGKTSAYVFNALMYINYLMPLVSASGIIKGIDSSMKRRGIALGDTIIRINDYTIDEYKALTQKITEVGELADSISITIKRDSAKFILSRKHLVDMPDSVFSYGYKDALAMGICKSHHIYRDSVSNSFYVKYIMDYKLKECSSN